MSGFFCLKNFKKSGIFSLPITSHTVNVGNTSRERNYETQNIFTGYIGGKRRKPRGQRRLIDP